MTALPGLLALAAALFLAGEPRAEVAMFETASQEAGFVDVYMVAREAQRTPTTSEVRFTDQDPEAGDRLSKTVFRLRAAASLAAHREFRYFAILGKDRSESYYLIGLLNDRDADYGEAFGERYRNLPDQGVLDTREIRPLP